MELIEETKETLKNKEVRIEDEINDTFDQVVAIIEERRRGLLDHLQSKVRSTCDRLGITIERKKCLTGLLCFQIHRKGSCLSIVT